MDNLESLKEKQEELENELKELGIQIEELEKQEIKKSDKRWRAENGGRYYYIDTNGETSVRTVTDIRYEDDDDSYNVGNYFQTQEEAERVIEKIKIYTRLKDLALRLNKSEEIDWKENKQAKYYIYYDYEDGKLSCSYSCKYKDVGQIYCLAENFLDIAKLKIGKENLIKLFV